MQVMPQDLEIFDRRKYLYDINYRAQCDAESIGERAQRLNILFHPERVTSD